MKITLIHDRQRWLIALFCLAIPAGILFAMTGVRIINRLATPASETGAVRHQTAVKSLNPATPAQAGGNYTITKSVITGGGDRSIGGNVELTGSIGQSLIGDSSGGPYSLGGGFWFKSISCPSITINPILSTLPAGVVGVAYSQTFTQTGGMGAATFNISSGTVPPGLNLSSGGVLSGTPTQTGTFSINIRASDANGCFGERSYSLSILSALARNIRVVAASGLPGGAVAVPIEMASQGDENAIGFSLNFDAAILSNPLVVLGSGAAGASLNVNLNQVASGRIGLGVAMPVGQTFAAGVRQIAVVTFTIAAATPPSITPITFGDQPIVREVVDINANELTTSYSNGSATITANYEADVAPRPNGNGALSIADWVQIGRFAAALDTPALGSEFQRADCAPRLAPDGVTLALGNGVISIADWVQAGRYAAVFDPPTAVGGPTGLPAGLQIGNCGSRIGNGECVSTHVFRDSTGLPASLHQRSSRVLRAISAENTVTMTLNALGDENALGFSLLFNPSQWRYVSTTLASEALEAMLNVNTKQISVGRLGVTLALPAGETFAAGAQRLVTFHFAPIVNNAGEQAPSLAVAITDAPVAREVVAANADTLPASFNTEIDSNTIGLLANVSAASFRDGDLARGQIVAAFGANLAGTTAYASVIPLPAELAGAQALVTDSAGVTREAPLFFVSPTQVNYQMPLEVTDGPATVMIIRDGQTIAIGLVSVTAIAPAFFTADASGMGLPAALALRSDASGVQSYEAIAHFDSEMKRFAAVPINLGPEGAEVFLVIYGTGIRGHSGLDGFKCLIGGVACEVAFAGAASEFVGVDQINLRIPHNLVGRGEVIVVLSVDGRTANNVKIKIK